MEKGALCRPLGTHRDRSSKHLLWRWTVLIPYKSPQTVALTVVCSTVLTLLAHACSHLLIFLLFCWQFFFPAVLWARLFILVKAQEASSRARVKGGQGRRQELESAARMFYVFPTPSSQLLLPLPHDGFALSFSLDSLHSKSTEKAITSRFGVGSFSKLATIRNSTAAIDTESCTWGGAEKVGAHSWGCPERTGCAAGCGQGVKKGLRRQESSFISQPKELLEPAMLRTIFPSQLRVVHHWCPHGEVFWRLEGSAGLCPKHRLESWAERNDANPSPCMLCRIHLWVHH